MAALHRRIAPLLCLVVVSTIALPCAAKPTREEIIAFAQTCKNAQRRMDLVAKFGADFSGLDLSGVDFRGYYAVGYETNLRNANLSNCDLSRAEFGAVVLDGADLIGANLEGATFITASLKQATLIRANLKGTKFYQSDLSGVKLTRADLSSADITGSTFDGADLSDAILSGAKNEYWWVDFTRANLTRANLSGLNVSGASFQGAVLRSADLSGAQLTQADFTGADLTNADLKDAHVESAIFLNAQGLSETERERLEGEAQRWKYEFKSNVAMILDAMYLPTYATVVIALIGLSFCGLRSQAARRFVAVNMLVNLLTFVPALVLFGMSLQGSSPTVQFNVGSPTAMKLWSAWVDLWPLFMLTLISCLAVASITALVFLASHWRWPLLKRAKLATVYVALTVVHCVFAIHWVGSHFPSA